MTASATSATTGRRPASAVAGPADLRRATRWLVALLMPVGPAAVALLRYNLPYLTTSDSKEAVAAVYADQGAESLVLWLGLVAVLTLLPGVYAVIRLTHRRSPRLSAAAVLLLVPGYLALAYLLSADVLVWTAAKAGVPQAQAVAMYGTAHPTSNIAAVVFVLGHVLGTVLLGIALWRTRQIPRPVAIALAVSQPLHFVAAVIVGSPTLDLFAWGLTTVGMTAAAVAVVRTPDDDWDLPPVTAGRPAV
ncbi:MAG: hypothetical protein ABI807_09130 [Sporichthyaceae bacterium]